LETVTVASSLMFCRATQQSFLRLLTMSSVMAPYGIPPHMNQQAWSIFEAFVADDRIVVQGREPAGLDAFWRRFSDRNSASPKLWMDAYLAAFARAGGHQMVTTDSAFAQFDGLDLLVLGS
jgi:uncharacterized protein